MTDITPEGMMLIGEKAVKPKKDSPCAWIFRATSWRTDT